MESSDLLRTVLKTDGERERACLKSTAPEHHHSLHLQGLAEEVGIRISQIRLCVRGSGGEDEKEEVRERASERARK